MRLHPIHVAGMGKLWGSTRADPYFEGVRTPTCRGRSEIFSAQGVLLLVNSYRVRETGVLWLRLRLRPSLPDRPGWPAAPVSRSRNARSKSPQVGSPLYERVSPASNENLLWLSPRISLLLYCVHWAWSGAGWLPSAVWPQAGCRLVRAPAW